MMINGLSKVKLNLSSQKKLDGSYVIGSKSNNVFIEIPEDAILILEYCNGEKTIDEITKILLKEKNIDVDVEDFIETLYELNLVNSIDGVKCNIGEEKQYSQILIKISKILFNKYTALIYGILFILNIILILSNNSLIPRYEDAFFIKEKIGVNMIGFFIISWMLTFIHEIGHFLSIVRLGVNVKFNLSLRLVWLVVEADINGLWSVPRKNRYFCYFAGVCFETVIMFISFIIKILNFNIIANNICSVIILVLALNFLWQFMVFLRTDFYLVLLTFFDLSGLYDYSKIYISSKLRKKDYNKQLENLSDKEMRYVKIFTITYVLGIIFCCIRLLYEIPIIINVLFSALFQMGSQNIYSIIDGILIIIVIIMSCMLWMKGAINSKNVSKAERSI